MLYTWKNAPVIAHKSARARIVHIMYAHAYNCMLADKNGGLLRGKQKALYLCNGTVLGKTPHLSLVSLFGRLVALGRRLAGTDWQKDRHTHTHTRTHTHKYRYPRCACAPKVNDCRLCKLVNFQDQVQVNIIARFVALSCVWWTSISKCNGKGYINHGSSNTLPEEETVRISIQISQSC